MARDVIFGKGRGWRPDDREYRRLRLGPGRGAAVGEYSSPEPGEYSDSYYGPGDDYARRMDPSDGYTRDRYSPRASVSAPVASESEERFGGGNPGYVGYGRLRAGQRSWADLGVHSVPDEQTRSRPSFRGRGPKGYVRSDERLREVICEHLTHDPAIDASELEVQVRNGEVTLAGEVRDRAMKWRAEDVAEECARGGVVHNRLRVQHGERP
jgi:hypothetical protein